MTEQAPIHELRFDGSVLRRGFWLYVWEVTREGKTPLYYVGRTGDSSSTNAQSPFNRMGQHLGFAKNSNMLRKYLAQHQCQPEACAFRLVALGPLEQGSEAVERAEHDKRRDVVAALERALAGAMQEAGYHVMNKVVSRKTVDMKRFNDVLTTFTGKFSALKSARKRLGRNNPTN